MQDTFLHFVYGNMKNNITTINIHNQDYPFVIRIPHSGTWIPDTMKEKMKDDVLLSNMDWYLP